ncbi:hypothetical protein ACP4OV_017473 [Aristida adscensionis]
MAIFQRYPRPDKEFQSFSLIYGKRSLDLICKDKGEAEAWFVGLKALISRQNCERWITERKDEKISNSPTKSIHRYSPLACSLYSNDVKNKDLETAGGCDRESIGFVNIFSDVILCNGHNSSRVSVSSISTSNSLSSGGANMSSGRASGVDASVRVSYSSVVSSSSYGSGDDFDSLGDVLVWGRVGDSMLAYASRASGSMHDSRSDVSSPKALESTCLLDIRSIACGISFFGDLYTWGDGLVVTSLGQLFTFGDGVFAKLFTWGDGDKGQLGHVDREARLVPACVASLLKPCFCLVACGHDTTVALSTCAQLYTMGSNAFGQLGNPKAHGKLPTLVGGIISSNLIEAIACGSHHVAALTSKAEVYTWGNGANGRLGHGDNADRNTLTRVEALKDKQVKNIVCGADFTAAW